MPDRSSTPTGASVAIITSAPGWRRLVPGTESLARRAVHAACRAAGEAAHVTITLADDRAIRLLNAAHRGKAKPTNVLSFPVMHGMGDVVLALETVRREARAEGKRAADHLAHLVAHGTLHLLGHDHLAAGEARRMERAESRAMAALRRPNPWKRA
ncbi:MAG: rRNA maturation RNase YbeY [Alphaproteobacteria bacterium]|jgi:probable rRNA maturation factor|nr:rRNA maturation RNase YbeY [Alphaproteobacteria bacterium]